jgi:SAM-dependent methyltransferase
VPFVERLFAFNRIGRNRWVEVHAARIPRDAVVLDVGAGDCPHRALFDRCTYIAQDFKRLDPQKLQGRGGYGSIGIASDVAAIPMRDHVVDVILCTEVLEHVPDPISSVREFGRLLRPGGILLLTAPLRSGLHQLPFHFYGGYTPEWYKKFLVQAGFAEFTIEPAFGILRSFAEDGLRVLVFLSPVGSLSRTARLLVFPLWLILLPLLGILFPLVGAALDRLDTQPDISGGYRIVAVRDPMAA